jgi:hypothetical protein
VIIHKAAVRAGLPPSVVSMQLLSKEDKKDMLDGSLTESDLAIAAMVWKKNNYNHFKKDFKYEL